MSTTRLLRSSKPLRHVGPPSATSSPFSTVKCAGKATGLNGEKKMVSGDHGDHKRKSTVAVKASVATSQGSLLTVEPPRVERGLIDLASLLATVSNALLKVLRPPALKSKQWKFQVQKLIEKVISFLLVINL